MAVCLLGMQTPKLFAQTTADFSVANVVCQNSNISVTNLTTTTNDPAKLSYSWSFGNSASLPNSIEPNPPAYVYWNAGAPSIYLTVYDSIDFTYHSVGKTITVNQTPYLNSYLPNNAVLNCNNAELTLSVTTSIIATAIWSYNGQIIDTALEITIDEPGEYGVYAISEDGCYSQNSTWEKDIQYHAPPSMTFNSFMGTVDDSLIFCDNQQNVSVNINSWSQIGIQNINWSDGSTAWWIYPQQNGEYSATLTDQDGCTVSDSFFVQINQSPVITFLTGQLEFCHGDSSFVSVGECAGCSYNWGGGETGQSMIVTHGGNYYITVTSSEGCVSNSLSPYFNEMYLPIANAYVNNGNELAAQTFDPVAGYQWYFNSTQIPGATGQYYTATETGYYYVTTFNSLGCESSSSNFVFASVTTGITEIDELTGVAIVQNDGDIQIFSPTSTAQAMILNINGQVVWNSSFRNETEFQTNNLSAGVYLISVATQKGKFTKKILIN